MTNLYDTEPEPLVVPLSADGTESLVFDIGGISGWASYHSPETQQRGLMIFLRVGPENRAPDSAIEMRELHVAADGGVFHSPVLRTIPIARIVAAINRPIVAAQLRPLLPPANLVQDGRVPGSGSQVYGLPPRRKVTLRPKLKIKDPGTRRKPDDFYAHIAETYLAQASISDRAAKDIAEANEVPYTTVHRWLKEARTRGLLKMPGQHGGEQA